MSNESTKTTAAKTRSRKPAAKKPAEVEPMPEARSKYTARELDKVGSVTLQFVPQNAETFANITGANGKRVFDQANDTTFVLGEGRASAAWGKATWQAELLKAFNNNTLETAVATLVSGVNLGKVGEAYQPSYKRVAAWLRGEAAQPSNSDLYNVAKHIKGYIKGWLLKPQHGNLQAK